MFIKVQPEFLKEIATNNERIPTLYYHPITMVSNFFWARLKLAEKIIHKFAINKKTALDFGCGAGIFLPTLSSIFDQVTGIDLEEREAKKIIAKYNLTNVNFIAGDISTSPVLPKSQDVIVAMDVLEHFKTLSLPVKQIQKWLAKEGILITSLPTENLFTIFLRKLVRQAKPFDHYHTGYEVEDFLEKSGFIRIKRKMLNPIIPLYLISVWKYSEI